MIINISRLAKTVLTAVTRDGYVERSLIGVTRSESSFLLRIVREIWPCFLQNDPKVVFDFDGVSNAFLRDIRPHFFL